MILSTWKSRPFYLPAIWKATARRRTASISGGVLREEVEQLGGYEENDVENDDDDEREGDASGRLVVDVVVVVVERRTIGRRVGAQLLRTTPPRSIQLRPLRSAQLLRAAL